MSTTVDSNPADRERSVTLVGQVVRNIDRTLKRWGEGWIEGELGDRCSPTERGHYFLTLRDPDGRSMLRLVIWASAASKFRHLLEPGARLQVRGSLEMYGGAGTLQFIAVEVVPVGLGALLARVEATRQLLVSEGLTNRIKSRLPTLPTRVGIIAAEGSAALADLREVAKRRWPGVELRFAAAAVQGPRAVAEIMEALAVLDADPTVDVIIVARGGGSPEDLLPFSEESLCRAVAATRTPVVAAVGHQTDTPLIELVSDARAATPTDAACLVVPQANDLQRRLDDLRNSRERLRQTTVGTARSRIEALHQRRSISGARTAAARNASMASMQAAPQRQLVAGTMRISRQQLEVRAARRIRQTGVQVGVARGALAALAETRARLHPEQSLIRRRSALQHANEVRHRLAAASVGSSRHRLGLEAHQRARLASYGLSVGRSALAEVAERRARLHPEHAVSQRRHAVQALGATFGRLHQQLSAARRLRLNAVTQDRPDPRASIGRHQDVLAARAMQRTQLAATQLATAKARAVGNAAQLEGLSPLRVLERGYALVTGPSGRLLRDPAEVEAGDRLGIRVAHGVLGATITGQEEQIGA